MDLTFSKMPPQNIEAEQAVLGAMLLWREHIPAVLEVLKPEDFYRTAHQFVYAAISALFENNNPVDSVTVAEELQKQELLEGCGGIEFLRGLMERCPLPEEGAFYARIVKEKSVRRKLIKNAVKVMEAGYEEDLELSDCIGEAENLILQISKEHSPQKILSAPSLLSKVMAMVSGIFEGEKKMPYLTTGLADLDKILLGLQPGNYITIAGNPGHGKTSLALGIMLHQAKQGIPSVMFSLEMTAEQIGWRILQAETPIDMQIIKRGDLDQADYKRVLTTTNRLQKHSFFIDDAASITAAEVKIRARRLKEKEGVKLVVVDYLQLMKPRKAENRNMEITGLCGELKAMAKELELPVIVLSQLTKENERRQNKRPQLSDLRDSGTIGQDSNVVMFCYLPWKFQEDGDAEIIVVKNRDGATGSARVRFQEQFSRFVNLSHREAEMEQSELGDYAP